MPVRARETGCARGDRVAPVNDGLRQTPGETEACGAIAHDIAARGWACAPDFLDTPTWIALADEARALWRAGSLREAAIGKGEHRARESSVRSDYIHWLEAPGATAAQQTYFHCLEALREALNRSFFLGLFEFEGHFALYPPGTFYRRHLDQFRGSRQRVLSCVLYLNEDWLPADGGQLRLYVPDGEEEHVVDIEPQGGTLLCFLSETFYHEVLPTRRERLSITGWFKVRG